MNIGNIFRSPFDDLFSNEDEAARRKKRLYIAGAAFVFLLPTIPSLMGGLGAYFDALEQNKKIADDELKVTREQLNAKGSDINQQSLWQVRQSRINDDLRSDIVKLSDGMDGLNKTVYSKMDEISKQILLANQQNEAFVKEELKKNGQVNVISKPNNVPTQNLPLAYNDKGKTFTSQEAQNIPVQVTVPATKNQPKQVLDGNLVLPPPPPSRNSQNTLQQPNQNYSNTYNSNTNAKPFVQKEFWPTGLESLATSIGTLSKDKGNKKDSNGELVIPMGAARGVLLTGATLKTLDGGKSEPKPVFIKLDSEYVYSNEMKLRVKGCTIEAAAVGDFGAGNSELRVSFFQCTAKDSRGQEYLASTDKIKAWVYDESNLYGVESRVVSKEGEIFAKSIPLALLNTGMSMLTTAANNYSQKQTTNADGTTTLTVPATQTATNETNTIMTRIGELWLDYLKAVSPVVQFRAGRKITVAFGGITKLKWEKVEMFQANKPLGRTSSNSRRNYDQY